MKTIHSSKQTNSQSRGFAEESDNYSLRLCAWWNEFSVLLELAKHAIQSERLVKNPPNQDGRSNPSKTHILILLGTVCEYVRFEIHGAAANLHFIALDPLLTNKRKIGGARLDCHLSTCENVPTIVLTDVLQVHALLVRRRVLLDVCDELVTKILLVYLSRRQ